MYSSKDDQKRQQMHSSNPPDNYQNYSAYSNPPVPSEPQPYASPQYYAQQPYQPPPPPPSTAPPYDGQPVPGIPISASSSLGPWSTGLCGCFQDVSNCCITCWCPCITFGQIAEIVDKRTSCCACGFLYGVILYFTGCACLYSCFYRSKLRKQYALEENPCADCCTHFCCEHCALCQEYRELKNQGFDMSIGWEGNLRNQHRQMPMAPMPQGGMIR